MSQIANTLHSVTPGRSSNAADNSVKWMNDKTSNGNSVHQTALFDAAICI